jgi:hypothetical protein
MRRLNAGYYWYTQAHRALVFDSPRDIFDNIGYVLSHVLFDMG